MYNWLSVKLMISIVPEKSSSKGTPSKIARWNEYKQIECIHFIISLTTYHKLKLSQVSCLLYILV